jgi:DNA-binding transcriptional ArsR family regulator
VLLALDCPRSTTELASLLGVTDSAVSQHLAILTAAGLVSRRRTRRYVLYLRSSDGDSLVRATGQAP